MPITEQQAVEWADSATADKLTTIRSPRADGRLTANTCRQMVTVSTAVVHCFVAGGPQPPILPLPAPLRAPPLQLWCEAVLRRDARKLQTLDGPQSQVTTLGNKNAAEDPIFLMTFGHEHEIQPTQHHVPFVRLMFYPERSAAMLGYIEEAVKWMMSGGTTRHNFLPLLWAGVRDWETSSAWTRGVVLLYAREYKKRVHDGLKNHQQVKEQTINAILVELGLHPDPQLHTLAHLPSLTASQARRNGVSERELRERWGC